jgi:hypothetical protein
MPTLNNRIDALERLALPKDQLTIWIISFDRPGADGPIRDEPAAYVGTEGERWDRQPGESLASLKARARQDVTRSASGFACLRECFEPIGEHHECA